MTEQTRVDDGWEEVEDSNFWTPEKEGDSIEGIIVSRETGDFGLKVTIESNKKRIVLPSHKVLQNRLESCKVGDIIKVIYEKEELPKVKGRNPTKIYKVLVKKI